MTHAGALQWQATVPGRSANGSPAMGPTVSERAGVRDRAGCTPLTTSGSSLAEVAHVGTGNG